MWHPEYDDYLNIQNAKLSPFRSYWLLLQAFLDSPTVLPIYKNDE